MNNRMSPMFGAHGSFDIAVRGNILCVNIRGAWNIETALEYKDAVLKKVAEITSKTWAVHSVINDWELCTPDSEIVIAELVAEVIRKGARRDALVNNTGKIKLELFAKYESERVRKNIANPFTRRFFETEESAMQWLKSEGYTDE